MNIWRKTGVYLTKRWWRRRHIRCPKLFYSNFIDILTLVSGKIAIPLLRIRNSEKRWYALKDKKLRSRAKGNGPQILLELTIAWNPIRACIRTLNPKEEKYMQTEVKFKRQVFVKNVLRLKVFAIYFYEFGKLFQWVHLNLHYFNYEQLFLGTASNGNPNCKVLPPLLYGSFCVTIFNHGCYHLLDF